MGRKRNEPPIRYLRVFNEGKLTREQIDWLLSNRKKGAGNVKSIRREKKVLCNHRKDSQ